jgi:PTH2 family peptidyl-tRNA hydrolase
MRNPDRIDRMLEYIREIWQKNPDLRLFQLLITSLNITYDESFKNLFSVEDSILLHAIHNWTEKIKYEEKDNELIQYFIVNTDLGMSSGKIASQVAHASMLITLKQQNEEVFKQWMNICMKKVVLGGKEKDLLVLESKGLVAIRDKGLTEISPNSLTCIGLPVMTRKQAKPFTKGLQLLKD